MPGSSIDSGSTPCGRTMWTHRCSTHRATCRTPAREDIGPSVGGGNSSNEDDTDHLDNNGRQDPPVANDDSVTARAGNAITIPVTGNDWDPDGDAIAVLNTDTRSPTHGTTDVLNGTSIAYRPELGYSGTDSFEYTLVDEKGETDTRGGERGAVPTRQPQPPADLPTRPGEDPHRRGRHHRRAGQRHRPRARPVDRSRPSRTTARRRSPTRRGPTGLPALRYQPPPDRAGIFQFTYQAADPQGGTSQRTAVTVEVSGADAENKPPEALPDAIRLRVGVVGTDRREGQRHRPGRRRAHDHHSNRAARA